MNTPPTYNGRFAGRWSGQWIASRKSYRFNAFTFDTGLARPQRTTVLQACGQLLERLHRYNGGYLKNIIPTTVAPRDEQGIAMLYDQMQAGMPAVILTTGDMPITPAGSKENWKGALQLCVYVAVNSARGPAERVMGDVVSDYDRTADPGAYVILEHVRQLLIAQKPGDAIQLKEIRPTHEGQVWVDDELEVWEQKYEIGTAISINVKRDIDLEISSIATYNRLASNPAPSDTPLVTTTTDLT